MNEEDYAVIMVLQTDCHHHLHNVWIGAVSKQLSKYLDDMLACDLSAFDQALITLTGSDHNFDHIC